MVSKGYDSNADVWSFGCLLYEIYALERPYKQYRDPYQIQAAVLKRHEIPTLQTSSKVRRG